MEMRARTALALALLACSLIPGASFLFGAPRRVVPSPVKLNPRFNGEPVLTLVEASTQSRVHLVGVAHGSSASANLVDKVIESIRPANVVVELCPERFLSISLEARIRPRFNETMTNLYDEKMRALEAFDAKRRKGLVGDIERGWSVTRFVASQGFVAGTFIMLGLAVSSLQKVARGSGSVGANGRRTPLDEFSTAMVAAERQSIEVSLGDAPQSDTLNSVKRVFTPELFSPKQVCEGALLLWFSVLGVGPLDSFKALGERIPRNLLDESDWLSIPNVYWQNRQMFQGLAPLLLISLSTTLLTLVSPLFSAGALADLSPDATAAAAAAASAGGIPTLGLASSILSAITAELPVPVEQAVDSLVDVFSILLLIRLTKLIGTDRDAVIAAKVQDACRRYPGKDVVVVIGLLHANGVARWLLSGEDPRTFPSPSPL